MKKLFVLSAALFIAAVVVKASRPSSLEVVIDRAERSSLAMTINRFLKPCYNGVACSETCLPFSFTVILPNEHKTSNV